MSKYDSEYPSFIATSDHDVASCAEVLALGISEVDGWKLIPSPSGRAVLVAPKDSIFFGGYVSRKWLKEKRL